MAGNKMGEQTRARILQSAQEVFIESGYENARVEEIARRAGVTKVMLYYHFNTKLNIFNEIVQRVMEEIKAELQASLTPADLHDPARFQEHMRTMMAFYAERQAVIRMVLAETIAGREIGGEALAAFSGVFDVIRSLAGLPADAPVQPQLLVSLFFFNALPMLTYTSLSDRFCAGFNLSPEQCMDIFAQAFTRSFYAATTTPD